MLWTCVTTHVPYLFVVIHFPNHMACLCEVEGNIFITQRVNVTLIFSKLLLLLLSQLTIATVSSVYM
jgi:hypothetical protein